MCIKNCRWVHNKCTYKTYTLPYSRFILDYLTNAIISNSDIYPVYNYLIIIFFISITENEQFDTSRCEEENKYFSAKSVNQNYQIIN